MGFSLKSLKSQAAIEFLFVVGFAMLLLFPSLALFGRFVQETTYTVTTSQLNKIGYYMLSTAKQAYYSTNGSIIVIEVNFPDGVKGMEIINEEELVFGIETSGAESELVFFSDVPINGTFNESDYTKGNKKFRFTSVDSTVFIERVVKY